MTTACGQRTGDWGLDEHLALAIADNVPTPDARRPV